MGAHPCKKQTDSREQGDGNRHPADALEAPNLRRSKGARVEVARQEKGSQTGAERLGFNGLKSEPMKQGCKIM